MIVTSAATANQRVRLKRTSGVVGKVVVGIVTNRDLRFETRLDAPVREIMTPRERLVWVGESATLEEWKDRPAQVEVPREGLVAAVRKMLGQ